ncbi:steroid 5-alpha reductase family enzyme [Aeromicrobium panaciterrae]|uniref:Steroid 5-alpha reductase family enzyme n=1 Tax=Aeromicrobium panaciterrae TaxID=363861 RepID=A0ABU1UJK0_9ACTN|nr:DUF1295 domain-containing protein [Aeromicrobium panaciterrae]MDR7085333.1 steroid 5-alpha reductase family enzyme [Aeromicrobium panaciterrae]
MSKNAALIRVLIAYVIAFAAAGAWLAWGPSTDKLWLDTLIADVIATVVIFVFSRAYKNSSFYDAYWSVIPPAIFVYWWIETEAEGARLWLVLLVISAWAIRLTGNWIFNWPGMHHEDWRYPMLKEQAGKSEAIVDFAGIHFFPTMVVFAALTPTYVVVTNTGRDVGWLDIVATIVGLGAVAIEFIADLQLYRFVQNRTPGQVMDVGLWGWSRHPNYFGEVSFWVSLALFGLAASSDDAWWIFGGAIAMLAMFMFASIPMMEKRSLERRPDYQDVIDRVSVFLPLPPKAKR